MFQRADNKRSWRLLPKELATLCETSEKGELIDFVHDRLILLVALDDLDGEVALGLTAAGGALMDEPIQMELEALPYETRSSVFELSPSSRFRQKEEFNYITLRQKLDAAPYFIAPLRKRPISGKPFAHRISVGRARNNDIVLRDGSVSKFHAWFETDGAITRIADAHSSNGTLLNGDALGRELAPAVEGDVVQFGSVRAIVCSAATLWEAFH